MRFRREGPPPHSGGVESCSVPDTCHNPAPPIRPYVFRTPHVHGAPTTEDTAFDADEHVGGLIVGLLLDRSIGGGGHGDGGDGDGGDDDDGDGDGDG